MTMLQQTLQIAPKHVRSGNRAWRKLKANKSAVVGLVIIVFFVSIAVIAPLLPIAFVHDGVTVLTVSALVMLPEINNMKTNSRTIPVLRR